jgi:1-acyl-sn-glycerol-3-phosphate acyltransferase
MFTPVFSRYVGENLLLMPNHQSTADVPFMMTIFTARPGFAGKAMWIMDKVRRRFVSMSKMFLDFE